MTKQTNPGRVKQSSEKNKEITERFKSPEDILKISKQHLQQQQLKKKMRIKPKCKLPVGFQKEIDMNDPKEEIFLDDKPMSKSK